MAGVDEVGRGPLAGDVVAAAVILEEGVSIPGLDDSKKLNERRREACYEDILKKALHYAIGRASAEEIDSINILNASLLAMARAVQTLSTVPEFVYVDGNRLPPWNFPCAAVVKGDGRLFSIAAASVVAKVTRDREMQALDASYPGYGFARHKGYPTLQHREALRRLGPSPVHRRSFKPVAEFLGDG